VSMQLSDNQPAGQPTRTTAPVLSDAAESIASVVGAVV
jgi:hypothetical protein